MSGKKQAMNQTPRKRGWRTWLLLINNRKEKEKALTVI